MKALISMLKVAISVVGILALAGSLAFAQQTLQPQSMKGAILKGKAPVSKEILKVKLPKAYENKLRNGLQVVVLEDHKLPTFSMQMVVLSGGLSDPPDLHGCAQFTASVLREGTKTRTSKQIAEQIDSLGGSLFANSSLSSMTSVVSASGLTDNFDQVMELFTDVILHPTFPADEVTKLKTRTLAQLRSQRSFPFFLASEMFSKVMYGDHPASRIAPSTEEVQRLTPEVLAKFHGTYYRPNNAIFAMVGDVKPSEVVAKLEKAFGAWPQGDVPATVIPKVRDTGAAKIYLVDRPGSVQTNLLMGTLSIERTDPDYYALQVQNRIVGGGPSARLFMNLREDKGYTYGAYSNVSALKFRGTFQASTEVRSNVTDGSMKELLHELNRIRDEKVAPEEFENATRAIVGSFALQLEFPQSVLQNIITQKLYGLPDDYWDAYPERIVSVTPEDVQRVARKYLDLDHLQVVAVGDAKQITDVLRKYGAVEGFDTDGKPLMPSMTESSGSSSEGTLAGTWSLIVNTPNGEITLKVVINLSGSEIGGSLQTPFGQSNLTGGTIKGNDVTFKSNVNVQGNATEVLFTAKLDGKSMKGTVSSSVFPPTEFKGTKEK